MRFDYKGIGHPTQSQLVDFTESLVDRQASVSAVLAAHIAACPRCAHEIKRMRTSLELAELSSPPNPSGVLTQEIVIRARAELSRRSRPKRGALVFRTLQYALCAVAVSVLALYSFSTALNDASVRSGTGLSSVSLPSSHQPANPGEVLQRTATVEALSSSLSIRNEFADSPRKTEYRRALELLDYDLKAARNALQRNPGNTRANQVLVMSLERQLEGLRDLYLDRSF